MGLDISAYSRMEPVEEPPKDDDGDIDWDKAYDLGYVHVFANAGFEASTRGLRNHDVVTTVGKYDWIADGCYRPREDSDSIGFRAGSYGSYGLYRKQLAALVGIDDPHAIWNNPEAHRDLPFFEQINFSDCEGTIGPEAAADLLKDYEDHSEAWLAHLSSKKIRDGGLHLSWIKSFQESYETWAKAFRLAADGGLVDYH